MSCFWKQITETQLQIPTTTEIKNVIHYVISVKIGEVTWTVNHRYREFYELHQVLCNDHGVSKGLLPPKSTIRNRSTTFIQTRRIALEKYLQNIFNYLKRTMPRVFIEFLDFNVYDTFYLLKKLAFQFYTESESILNPIKSYTLNPIELYAINVCFKEPFPNVVETDKRYDISHVLDFCTQLIQLNVNGDIEEYRTSNIRPNRLQLDMSMFKNLQNLQLDTVFLDNIKNVGTFRTTLTTLSAIKSDVLCVREVLLCDVIHKSELSNQHIWTALTCLDLSFNNIRSLKRSINLAPNLHTLRLSHNEITEIGDLSNLSKLTRLYLDDNRITSCENLRTKLGNVIVLDLSQNDINKLEGFSKLYSLEYLNLSCNNIVDIYEISHIGSLPCLENLLLTGNHVATVIDYRAKVFEYFGSRARELCLDNEKATQGELDKAALFQALTIVREGKSPKL